MGLSRQKSELHDALWHAQQRWFQLRAQGYTKHELKVVGLRNAGDPNLMTRDLIFAGRTRLTYERDLKLFVTYVHQEHGVQHLRDVTAEHARGYLDRTIDDRWAAKSIHKLRSELSKLGVLIGKAESMVALSKEYGAIIRGLTGAGVLAGPTRQTPSAEVVGRAVEALRQGDLQHGGRAYHLAARLQLETAARSVSVTERFARESLKEGQQVEVVGKGGQRQTLPISAELHDLLRVHLTAQPGPLANLAGYRAAFYRAMQAVGGRVTGTHGLRRLSAQRHCSEQYRVRLGRGASTRTARQGARQDAVERLGHGRDRVDQANAYLGEGA